MDMSILPSRHFYVYVLSRPDRTPFYVGKGHHDRIAVHERAARRGHTCHRCNIIRKIWREGGEVQRSIVLTTTDEQEAFEHERKLIATIGRKNLCNLTDGGEGSSNPAPDVRARRRAASKRIFAEHRAKVMAGLARYYERERVQLRALLSEHPEYIPVEDVSERLKVSVRQASRYGAKLRTQRAGRRVLYHRDDVEQLAEELGAEHRVAPPQPRTDLLPPGEFLQTFERQQSQIAHLSREVGRLEGQVEAQRQQQRQLTESTEDLQARLSAAESQREALQAEVERLRRRSWWRRLLDI